MINTSKNEPALQENKSAILCIVVVFKVLRSKWSWGHEPGGKEGILYKLQALACVNEWLFRMAKMLNEILRHIRKAIPYKINRKKIKRTDNLKLKPIANLQTTFL